MSNLQDLEQRMDRVDYQVISDDKDKTIADLEAKLAEKEYLLNIKDGELNNVHKLWQNKIDEVKQLKQQLTDTEAQNKRVLEKLDIIVRSNQELEQKVADLQQEQIAEMKEHQEAMKLADNTITNLVEDNRASQEWYKKQIAEKDKTIENLRIDLKDYQDLEEKISTKYDKVVEKLKKADQDKISFCIEKLEKVKDYAIHIQGGLINYIDNQIKQLRR